MKKLILFEFLRKLKSKPAMMRQLKIIVLVGFMGLIFVGGIAIWTGVQAINYVVATTSDAIKSPAIQSQFNVAKREIQQIQLQPLSCWNKVQSLLAIQPWLEKPALYNFKNLKVACFNAISPVCEGFECTQMKNIMTTAEGGTI